MTDIILGYWGPVEAAGSSAAAIAWSPGSLNNKEAYDPVLTHATVYGDAAAVVSIRVGLTAAALSTALTGDDNDIDITARRKGTRGTEISITLTDPSANDAELAISVSGVDITASLATDDGGTITTTAKELRDAINNHPEASQLVSVAFKTGNDGSGVVTALAKDQLESGTDTTIEIGNAADAFTDQYAFPPGEFRGEEQYIGVAVSAGTNHITVAGYWVPGIRYHYSKHQQ